MEEHIHFLSDLHPSIALADFMRDLKTSSSLWLKQNKNFPEFDGWAEGYAALTYSYREKDIIINYINNQQEHHKIESFTEELHRLLEEQGVEIDEQYFP
jgi:REP element-mobilizing transposase RayT